MSDTQQLIALAAVWTIISLFIARLAPNWPGRVALLALLVGIPFWELPFGVYNFERLCKEETKLFVYDQVLPQDSVCVDDLYRDLYTMLVPLGFARIEFRGRTNVDSRDLVTSTQIASIKKGEEKSLYCYSSTSNKKLPWRILRYDNLLDRARDGRNIARQSGFSWAGMWWQEQARPILGSGGHCGAPLEALFKVAKNGTHRR